MLKEKSFYVLKRMFDGRIVARQYFKSIGELVNELRLTEELTGDDYQWFRDSDQFSSETFGFGEEEV